jgi:3-oxoacyl-[acyl-carrier protein] reductase
MTSSSPELAGQVAVVTGAARNIGRAICLELAAAGAAVVVNALTSTAEAEDVANEINAAGGEAIAHIADVTNPAAVKAMMDAAVARFGKLTVLVNNASVRRVVPLAEMTLEEWRAVQSVIVEGAFLCAQAAAPHIRDAGGGTIINIGGIAAHKGVKDRLHASTAKAAVAGMARSLALDVAADNIMVNCVSPGTIDTVRGASAGTRPGGMTSSIPLGRLGETTDIAAMVRMLCGPGGRYVTGQTIHVNGGSFLT